VVVAAAGFVVHSGAHEGAGTLPWKFVDAGDDHSGVAEHSGRTCSRCIAHWQWRSHLLDAKILEGSESRLLMLLLFCRHMRWLMLLLLLILWFKVVVRWRGLTLSLGGSSIVDHAVDDHPGVAEQC
jgi:hypothetical protein